MCFPKRKENTFQAGFTLFEVLAALVLLSLVLSRIIPGFIQILDSNARAQQRLEAYLLGSGKLEEILCQAERAQEGKFPAPWSQYNWRYDEEKSGEFINQILTVKWKDHLDERQVYLRKLRINTE